MRPDGSPDQPGPWAQKLTVVREGGLCLAIVCGGVLGIFLSAAPSRVGRKLVWNLRIEQNPVVEFDWGVSRFGGGSLWEGNAF